MSFLRRWIRIWFGFSRRETNGFLILLPLMILILASRPLYQRWDQSRSATFEPDPVEFRKVMEELAAQNSSQNEITPPELFYFDPNTVTIPELQELGFPRTLAGRLEKYRSKGGKFTTASDLLKLYGLDSVLYNQLLPYVRISPAKSSKQVYQHNVSLSNSKENTKKREVSPFDLNDADSTMLVSIRGIGPVLSSRIIRFREKLGGFVHSHQVYEVYGLDSAVADELIKSSFLRSDQPVQKMNVNLLSADELSQHPYISKSLAKALVAYRKQHGPFKREEDVRNIHILNEEIAQKIIPYLTTEN